MVEPEHSPFDFAKHKRDAIAEYYQRRDDYQLLASEVEGILRRSLEARKVKVASIQSRAKAVASFAKKACRPATDDPSRPKYLIPLREIEDLAGVRVITFFLETVTEVTSLINELFQVREYRDKADALLQLDRFGYQSVHFIVSVKSDMLETLSLPQLIGLTAEIQVRTILQHAWAEIEHDIQYKSADAIPALIRRRFGALAGMLEIADREFQAIQAEDRNLRDAARTSVKEDRLEDVEVTADALKAYLDKLFGLDARVVPESYELCAYTVRKLGFRTFREIDDCIAPYLSMNLIVVAWRSRPGQIVKFETILLAAIGDEFLRTHPRCEEASFVGRYSKALKRLQANGIPIGTRGKVVNFSAAAQVDDTVN